MSNIRNPVIIPENIPSKINGCPKCKSDDFSGRVLGGSPMFTCNKCGNRWQGGRYITPEDPTVPQPPMNPNDRPVVAFSIDKNNNVKEHRRSIPLTQEFRKGSRVPNPGEDDV